jgi:hypothetical protein
VRLAAIGANPNLDICINLSGSAFSLRFIAAKLVSEKNKKQNEEVLTQCVQCV